MKTHYSVKSKDSEGNWRDVGVEVGCEYDNRLREDARVKNATNYLYNRAQRLAEDYLPNWSLGKFTVEFSERIVSNLGWFRCTWKRINVDKQACLPKQLRCSGERVPTNVRLTLSYHLCHYPEWICDSVLFHEVCHMLTPGQQHSYEFWQYCDCYPYMREVYRILHGREFPI